MSSLFRALFGRGKSWAAVNLPPARDALLVLLANVLLALLAWYYLSQAVEDRDRARFDDATRAATVAIETRIDQYIDVLRGSRGLVGASQLVGRAEWAYFVNSMDLGTRYPGIAQLGYVQRLWPDDKEIQLAKVRSQGLPFLSLWPEGERDEYYPVLYLEPVDEQNRQLLGYDVMTDPVRREAMEKARDTGLPAATAKLLPVQGQVENESASFAIYVPFYRDGHTLSSVEDRRASLIGFVYAQYRVDELMKQLPGDGSHPIISLEIFDGRTALPKQLLYRRGASPSQGSAIHSPSLSATTSLMIAGQPWTLRVATLPDFGRDSQRNLSTLVLIGGLAISLLVFAFNYSRAKARAAVDRMAAEREQLEDQLRQAQKMESMGRLAGGVAHDFNNLLTVVMGFSDLLLQQLDPDDPKRSLLEEIAKAGERGSSLTGQLLAFSRRQILAPKPTDLNAVIGSMRPMLNLLVGEDVELATVLDPRLSRVMADPGQIEQVIMNLATNARDAMPQGGRLTIQTTNVYLDESYSTKRVSVDPGPHVMLTVSDTGTGIDPKTQEQIFEPFFTTKPKGKGTGLGLSTVLGIVQQSGGHVRIYSELGWGTTFKVYLPTMEDVAEHAKHRSAVSAATTGTETVLVSEDEDTVRSLAVGVLRSHGYEVLEVSSGEEALRVAKSYDGTIHLLVTDVVMPGMSGRDLAEQLAYYRMETRVLYMSGYTDDDVVRRGVLHDEMAFLQKPFKPNDLLKAVREVLDGDAEDASPKGAESA